MAGHRWGFQRQHLAGCHERPRQLRWCGADQGASRTALNRRGVSHERGILTLSTGAAPAFGADWGRASISPNGPRSLVGSEFRWPRQAGSHRAKLSLLARSRCTRMLRTRGPQAAPAQAGSWRSRLAHAGARNRAAFRDHRRSTRSTTLARRRAGCWQGRPPGTRVPRQTRLSGHHRPYGMWHVSSGPPVARHLRIGPLQSTLALSHIAIKFGTAFAVSKCHVSRAPWLLWTDSRRTLPISMSRSASGRLSRQTPYADGDWSTGRQRCWTFHPPLIVWSPCA